MYFVFYFILFIYFFFQVFNFKLKISQFKNSKCHKFQNSNIPISNFKFLNLNLKFIKFKLPISKLLSFKFISKFLISNISNYQFQNFNFKSVFKNSKHMINSIVPIKWDLVELICVTYKWAWVGSDISCILLTNNLTFNL